MEKRYYTADSLRRSLDAFEERFGMSSDEFFAAYAVYDISRMEGISPFLRHSWASLYRDWQRLSGDDFAASVKRELEIA